MWPFEGFEVAPMVQRESCSRRQIPHGFWRRQSRGKTHSAYAAASGTYRLDPLVRRSVVLAFNVLTPSPLVLASVLHLKLVRREPWLTVAVPDSFVKCPSFARTTIPGMV